MYNIMKIFVIGFNKTGTSSLHELFKQSNINSCHTTTPVMDIINDFDAFTDGGHYNFTEYYDKYPSSLFILNTRPICKWLISRYKHAVNYNFEDSWCWPISKTKTISWIKKREEHYKSILDFFIDKPKQLMVVNIEKINWQVDVLNFIKKPIIYKNIHMNRININNYFIEKQITKNVNECLMDEGYTCDELLIKGVDIKSYEYASNL